MSDFVKSSHVFLDNPATTVDEALRFLSAKSVELGISTSAPAVLDAFRTREEEGTTGMVDGFAIPHAKTDAIGSAAVCVVKFVGDVAWESMDGAPIRVAIALLVPGEEAGTTHLKLLSKVAVMLMDAGFRERIMVSGDPESIAAEINARLS